MSPLVVRVLVRLSVSLACSAPTELVSILVGSNATETQIVRQILPAASICVSSLHSSNLARWQSHVQMARHAGMVIAQESEKAHLVRQIGTAHRA